MLDILLKNGSMTIENCGDAIEFTLYGNDDRQQIKQITLDYESIVDMIFIAD